MIKSFSTENGRTGGRVEESADCARLVSPIEVGCVIRSNCWTIPPELPVLLASTLRWYEKRNPGLRIDPRVSSSFCSVKKVEQREDLSLNRRL